MNPRSKQRIILYWILSEATFNPISTAQKMKETADLATFTEEILNGKLHIFLCCERGHGLVMLQSQNCIQKQ